MTTKEQSKVSKWRVYRIERITASKPHDVIMKYDSNMTVRNKTAAKSLCAVTYVATVQRSRGQV